MVHVRTRLWLGHAHRLLQAPRAAQVYSYAVHLKPPGPAWPSTKERVVSRRGDSFIHIHSLFCSFIVEPFNFFIVSFIVIFSLFIILLLLCYSVILSFFHSVIHSFWHSFFFTLSFRHYLICFIFLIFLSVSLVYFILSFSFQPSTETTNQSSFSVPSMTATSISCIDRRYQYWYWLTCCAGFSFLALWGSCDDAESPAYRFWRMYHNSLHKRQEFDLHVPSTYT